MAYELLKQVNAFALEALNSAPSTATERAIFFMTSILFQMAK